MHRAAYRERGLDATYVAFDVAPKLLGDALRGARALGIRQLAVSLPHKVAVRKYLDRIDPVAQKIGAVNTITRVEDELVGSNTDWQGALRALEREAPVAGRRAVVLGAGGTARALVYALCREGAEVTVLNRTVATAEGLAADLGARAAGPLGALPDHRFEILVNTTSVGLGSDLSPVAAEALHPDCVVMDAVYEPARTRLLRDAAAAGARTVEGKWMLVHQAALQFESWSGCKAPLEAMARAFDQAGGSGT
jgi:shikimate dehydrogenase